MGEYWHGEKIPKRKIKETGDKKEGHSRRYQTATEKAKQTSHSKKRNNKETQNLRNKEKKE